jgi:hypothetical protein
MGDDNTLVRILQPDEPYKSIPGTSLIIGGGEFLMIEIEGGFFITYEQ